MTDLDGCRVVLVRPHYAGNVGSVARAMANFGLKHLVIVAPVADLTHPDARMMAVRAAPILHAARVVGTLAEAVADCGWVLATSGEVGGLVRRGFWGPPDAQIPVLLDALAATPVALVFGPEPSGLTVDEIAACHAMASVPVDPDYPSMNLAQAVAVTLYELRRQWLARAAAAPPDPAADRPADFREQEILFARLREALESVRFLWDHRAGGLFHVIRQVVVRARPTVKELKVLHGLAGQLLHVARVYRVTHPRAGRPAPLPPGFFDPPPGGNAGG